MPHFGKILVFAGIILIIAGLIVYFAGDKLGWIGHLPGDIRVEKDKMRFYFPITTMILFSLVLSVVVWIIKKIF